MAMATAVSVGGTARCTAHSGWLEALTRVGLIGYGSFRLAMGRDDTDDEDLRGVAARSTRSEPAHKRSTPGINVGEWDLDRQASSEPTFCPVATDSNVRSPCRLPMGL